MALVLQEGIVLARQRPQVRQRRLVAAEGGVVEHAGGALIRHLGVVVVAALAGEPLGARIEIGPLLDDDAGARAAVLVTAGEHRVPARIDDHALFLCLLYTSDAADE